MCTRTSRLERNPSVIHTCVVTQVPAGAPNAWEAGGCVLRLRLSFARPLVAPWQPPPPPPVPLSVLVPPRDLHPPPPPLTPEEQVKAGAGGVLRQLARAYAAHAAAHGDVDAGAACFGDGGRTRVRPEKAHKRLIWELNTSGRWVMVQSTALYFRSLRGFEFRCNGTKQIL